MVQDPATTYALDVIDGKILTGELVRLACERHLRWIEQPTKKHGLKWDVAEVDRFIRFAELHHHYKGRWAKEPCTCDVDAETCAKRIILQPWQAFCGGSLVGWKRQNDAGRWVRAFYTGYIQVSRKTGKTHFGAIVGNYCTFSDGEPGAEGYVAAAAGHQARYVHDIFKSIVRASPHLDWIGGCSQKLANIYADNSYIAPVSSESKNLDSLSPHFILLDELHAHRDSSVRDVLDTGTGGRDQPLMLEITTAGEEREDSICKAERDYGEQVLRGDVEDRSFFAYIAELDKGDDWREIGNYIKCIPSLGVTIREEDLARKIRQAEANPLIRDSHKIKIANMWISVFSGMFDAERWRACDRKLSPADLEALRGRVCYAGIDLAEAVDMSALALVFPPDDIDTGEWIVRVFYWIPAATLERKSAQNKAIKLWHRKGMIEVAGEERMDYAFIRSRIREIADLYKVPEIAFDPWKASDLATQLENEGFFMVQVRQGHATLSGSVDGPNGVVGTVAEGRLCYDDSPVVRWNAANCVAREDSNGNRVPSKKRQHGNIDGVSAMLTAWSRALANIKSGSIYNEGSTPTGHSVYSA